MSVAVVSLDSVCCRYNAADILREVTLSVSPGDYLGIVGPNGAGKSTLIKAMLGLVEPAAGEVRLFGTPLRHFREWNRVGYLSQGVKFMNPLLPATVEEIVRLGLLAGKAFPKRLSRTDRVLAERAMEALGISHIRDSRITELSGGQQQRMLLARAIVNEPELLVLDEPTTALDPETRERFFTLLDELSFRRGTTILLVTHDTGTIGRHASRLLYVDKRVVFNGTFDDFCRSDDMTGFFGERSQHLICHRH